MEEIKKMLLKQKDELIAHLNEHEEVKEHDVGDDIDSSVDEQGREMMFLMRDRDRVKLEKIDDALERIETDEYGLCDECGDDINKKRLMILPFATLCLNCQQESERLHGKSLVYYDDSKGFEEE